MFRRYGFLLFLLCAAPAFAQESPNSQSYALPNKDNLIISLSEEGAYWTQYTITYKKNAANKTIDVPLQIEEIDTDSGKLQVTNGVTITTVGDYNFDPVTGNLEFGQKDGYVATYNYEYKLADAIFKLQRVTKTEFTHCDDQTGECKDTKDTVIFKAHAAHG